MAESGRRVAVIGGGPGGLLLATLLKDAAPSDHIVVFEQNPADATYGFGVAFTDVTLDYFGSAAPWFEQELREYGVRWEHVEVRHRGRVFRCDRNPFTAIQRSLLLGLLQRRAEEAGVETHFEQRIADLGAFDDFDVVVGADGVNSVVRSEEPEAFGVDYRHGAAKYIWFGSDAPDGELFDALTFSFMQNEHGAFGIHAYPYGSGLGESETAIIVETDEQSWRRAGLDRHDHDQLPPGESDLLSKAYCEELFADDLRGWPLVTNNSKWLNFPVVRCARWHAGNRVLLGDAVHTAHFSLGSGTKLAMEDAIALSQALRGAGRQELDKAFSAYEAERRPAIERLQRASEPSRLWWENFRHIMHLAPHEFAFNLMTRSGFMTWDRLRQRDHHFTDAILRDFLAHTDRVNPAAFPPVSAPYEENRLVSANRIVGDARLEGDHATERDDLARAFALLGAGSVVIRCPAKSPLAETIRRGTHAKAFLELAPALNPTFAEDSAGVLDQALAGERADAWDGLIMPVDLRDLGGELSHDLATILKSVTHGVSAVKDRSGGRPALITSLLLPPAERSPLRLTDIADLARAIADAGAAMVGVDARDGHALLPHLTPQAALLVVTNAIRNHAGVPTMLLGGVRTDDEANTLVLSRRVDLVCGSPRIAGLGWDHERTTA